MPTDRLRLRPFTKGDLDALLTYRRDPEVARYQSWSSDFAETAGKAFIEGVSEVQLGTPGRWVNLAVELSSTQTVVGDVALCVEPDGSAGQIAFTFSRDHQGNGYAREAAGALVDFAWRALRLPIVYGITDARNARSIRLLESIGFKLAGFHARNAPFKGELCDELRFERRR